MPGLLDWAVWPAWFELLGVMRWPLAACGVLCLAICLERIVFMVGNCARRRKAMAELTRQLMRHKDQPKAVRDEVVEMALNDLQRDYFSGVKTLRVIGVISPLLGLLGTILGIISAFQGIASQTGPVSPSLIAGGLWEAMLTTVAGLVIALPALLMSYGVYHFGESRIRDLSGELNKLSLSLELEKGT